MLVLVDEEAIGNGTACGAGRSNEPLVRKYVIGLSARGVPAGMLAGGAPPGTRTGIQRPDVEGRGRIQPAVAGPGGPRPFACRLRNARCGAGSLRAHVAELKGRHRDWEQGEVLFPLTEALTSGLQPPTVCIAQIPLCTNQSRSLGVGGCDGE
jgi:hypothetical protein